MLRKRNTKIIATLGPSTATPELIEKLFISGADVFRLNFSHGTHEQHKKGLSAIRQLEEKLNRPIGVLADLQGPKLRIGTFDRTSIRLSPGDILRLDLSKKPGNKKRVSFPHPEIISYARKNLEVLFDDGRIRGKVIKTGKNFMDTEISFGGELSSNKGVNIPNSVLKISSITKKDLRDLKLSVAMHADWIALSFIQKPEDIRKAKKMINSNVGVLAKFEKPMAIKRNKEIISLSDAIMVARGDLGVEVPPEEVPILQRKIIHACRKAGKPVVIATQMLDSMVAAPFPTRAEASDVASAVYDGADAVMLSAETAIGKYPVEAVKIMDRIIRRVEKDPSYRKIVDIDHPEPDATTSDAISVAAAQVAKTLNASVITTYTKSGGTARRAARERPTVPILGLTAEKSTARQLCMVWGVYSVHTEEVKSFPDMVEKASRIALAESMAKKNDRLVITAGVPFGQSGATNVLRIVRVGVPQEWKWRTGVLEHDGLHSS